MSGGGFLLHIDGMDNGETTPTVNLGRLKKMLAMRFGLAVLILAAMFFLPAGTLNYWQAWIYHGHTARSHVPGAGLFP